MVVAGHDLHPSHEIWRKGAWHFCGKCGTWCRSRPVGIMEWCPAAGKVSVRLKAAQHAVLARLRKGLPPLYRAAWGDEGDELIIDRSA